jgi:competence protein ComEA
MDGIRVQVRCHRSPMPTPAERKALLFLTGVIVLGAGVRVVRAARDDGSADASTRQALTRQLAAVDSARTEGMNSGGPRASRRPPVGRRRGRRPASQANDDSSHVSSREPTVQLPVDHAAPILVIDLDVAGQSDIETLPRIGPVLARRIIEDRSANGPFGSIEGFERVRGVGPSLARALRERVTFSGTARPSNAVVDPRLRSPPSPSKSPRRDRRPLQWK